MKLPPARLAAFLRSPPPEFRAALLYGPDGGLVRERADALTAAVCPDLKDPFRIGELGAAALAADPARLADELAAMSLIGGRRVVRLRGAGDGVTALLSQALAGPRGDSFLVIEAGDLPARSSLRKLCEGAADIAVIGCYADAGRDLADVVRETLGRHRIGIAGDALSYLVAHLGNDRLVTRSELEKLALYAGDGGRVELADAVACIGDSTALSVEELAYAAAEGDAAKLDTALARCLQEGQSPIGLIRALMRHFQRLHLASGRVAAGMAPEEALRALRPPVFFKLRDRFKAQLALWPPRRAAAALDTLMRAELDCKRAILPQEAVLGDALFALARAAKRAA
ncbi:MAG TPA: DNA polymerase III subunit delta [Stellaceae bacterium]|nr:DNA polymerase III subunit delta [Stellaceae bacterium]